jgi:sugar lactone lactonase YvrE
MRIKVEHSHMNRAGIALILGLLLCWSNIAAHPGSGIVVDKQGNVYFVDTGSGIWKIDNEGKLTKLSGPAYHWMAIDIDARLRDVPLPYFSSGDATVTRVGIDPTLLLSSDFPLAVGPDGDLYYPGIGSSEQLQIFHLPPSGSTTVLTTLLAQTGGGMLRWLNGIAASTDGSVCFSENRAIRRISPEGEVTTVVGDVTLSGCDSVPEVGPELGPYFRGLDVDSAGNVYVAATGCRAVLKITPGKHITTILRTTGPWSPTAVAVSGADVYVLEYFHTEGDNRREWYPRVRKVSSDGTIATIATIVRQ